MFRHDLAFGNFQLFGQETTQRRIRFSSYCRSPELDFNRVAMLSHDAVGFRVWNYVKTKRCHFDKL